MEPKWEDPTCEFGGKWTVLVPKSPNSKQVLDTYWLNAVSGSIAVSSCLGDKGFARQAVMAHAHWKHTSHLSGVAWQDREMCASALQLLACIGEQFTEGEEICGVVINVRAKQDKLCIWTKSASNEAAQVIL